MHFDADRLGLASSLRTISKGRASFERDASGKRRLVVKGVLGWLSVLVAAGSIVIGLLVMAGFLVIMLFAQSKVMFLVGATMLLSMALPPLIWLRTPWGKRSSEGNALTYLFAAALATMTCKARLLKKMVALRVPSAARGGIWLAGERVCLRNQPDGPSTCETRLASSRLCFLAGLACCET
jgi:hypothetical protein